MSIIKSKNEFKISSERPPVQRSGICDEYPVFCFKHLTTNNRYNFDKNKKINTNALMQRICFLCNRAWKDMFQESKKTGLEGMDYGMVNIEAAKKELFEPPISKDTKVYIFRFGGKKHRLIGIKRSGCSIFHIIGIDWDLTAYNHGR